MFNDIINKFGIEVRFVDSTDPKNFAAAADDKTRAFFCETCSNPACEVVDLKAVADLAHANGVPLMVDAIDGQLKLCVAGSHSPTQLALAGAKTTMPLGVVAAPSNLAPVLMVDAIGELQLKVPALVLCCSARPRAGDIPPRLGRCNAAAAAAVAITAGTIAESCCKKENDLLCSR